jgi:hypothetical protein
MPTDVDTGLEFMFVPGPVRLICSDLQSYPIGARGRGVEWLSDPVQPDHPQKLSLRNATGAFPAWIQARERQGQGQSPFAHA